MELKVTQVDRLQKEAEAAISTRGQLSKAKDEAVKLAAEAGAARDNLSKELEVRAGRAVEDFQNYCS